MNCVTCSRICQTNATGLCLACQRGFINNPQEDSWALSDELKKMKLEELENAIKESSPAEISMGERSKISERVRTRDSKGEKASEKS